MIDWLTGPVGGPLAGRVLMEPPVTQTALRPVVTVAPLDAVALPVGLITPDITGLPVDLWQGSAATQLARQIASVPVARRPTMQTLLYTLLLAETIPPGGQSGAEALLLARVDRLMGLGAVDPAQALLEVAGPTQSQARFTRWFEATLLTGDEERSCAALRAQPHLSPGYAAQIFCAVRAGDWPQAALVFDTAQALQLLPQDELDVLDRFINPDLFEDAEPLPIPDAPDALRFRLHESIGEPLPTAALPRAFATADLRDLAGWKSQLEAAERLSRTGAMPPNQLLGLYGSRQAAASGGVWDRVDAVQRFETALKTGNADAISKSLPAAWTAMRSSQLEVAFAALFADALAEQALTAPSAQALIWQIALLSPDYELAARTVPSETDRAAFLAGVARGEAPVGTTALERAIAAGFADMPQLSATDQAKIAAHQLGEVVLGAISQFDIGANGNLDALTSALITLRAVGLEDTARRAALQLLLLGDA